MAMTSQEKFRVLADQIKISNQLDKEIARQQQIIDNFEISKSLR